MEPVAVLRSPRSAAAAPRSLLSAAAAPWSPEAPLAQTSARSASSIESAAPRAAVRLFVSNLPFDATEDDVRQAFEHVCWVEHVKMPVDHETGLSRGLAFVTLKKETSKVDGEAVRRRMHGSILGNRGIRVEVANAPAGRVVSVASASRAASIALNKELVSPRTAAADILALFEKKGNDMNAVNLATSTHRLGLLSCSLMASSDPRLQRLVERATSSIVNDSKQWESRHLANACWGIAKIGNVAAPALFEAVAVEAPKKIAMFNPQNLANTVWAYATAGVEAPALFEAVAAEAPKKIAMFDPQNLANTVWAYSTAGVEAPALFEAVAAEAPKKIAMFNPQNLANTVWAYSTAGVEAPALFEAVAAEAPKKIAMFDPQNLANTVWAYSTAGVEAPALFEAVAVEAPKKIAMFNPQDLANTVWAYSTAGVEALALFEAVAAEAPKKIAMFDPQNLANTVWAYSTAGVEAPALFEAVAVEAPKKIAMFNPQDLANTVWAYSTAGVEALALFEAVATESSKKIATFTPQSLANTAWAFSTAGVEAPALFEVMAFRIEAKISDFSHEDLSQLHQVYIHLRLEAPQHTLTLLLSRHETELHAAYIRQESRPSQTQREVSAALARIGWAHEFEHVTAEGISLDMAQPASKVAVEFDGPTHYLVGASDGASTRILNGKSKFKARLLRSLGWTVIRVPYFSWNALRSSADSEAYLRDRMTSAGGSM